MLASVRVAHILTDWEDTNPVTGRQVHDGTLALCEYRGFLQVLQIAEIDTRILLPYPTPQLHKFSFRHDNKRYVLFHLVLLTLEVLIRAPYLPRYHAPDRDLSRDLV